MSTQAQRPAPGTSPQTAPQSPFQLSPPSPGPGRAGESGEQVRRSNAQRSREGQAAIARLGAPVRAVEQGADGVVVRDGHGFIVAGPDLRDVSGWTLDRPPHHLETSVPGVFAAGDVTDQHYRQAITSAGTLGRPRRDGNKSANIASGNSWLR